ncbi:MAG: LOG family protein, partial [Saprospiraceae bacterium]
MSEKQNGLLKNKQAMKQWNKLKGENSWTMFKVISEFVDGFERLNVIGPCVSIFGSARTKPENPFYKIAVDIARRLTEEGWGVITGGGPGIMEAGNKGASLYGGVSVGLCGDCGGRTGVA